MKIATLLSKTIEGVTFNPSTKKFEFDFNQDASDSLIYLSLQPYNTKLSIKDGNKIYYAYKINPYDKTAKSALKVALKYLDSNLIDKNDAIKFVDTAIDRFETYIAPLKSYDVIIAPKSTSLILKLFISRIKHRVNSTNTLIIDGFFTKLPPDQIVFDEVLLSKIPPEKAQWIRNHLTAQLSKPNFKLRDIDVRYRRYIKQFLTINPDIEAQILSKISSGNVLIIDDLLTGGSTMKNMVNLIKNLNANSITSFVLLADRYS